MYLDKNKIFYGYIIVVVSFIIAAVSWGTFYSFGIFFTPILSDLGWSKAVTSGAFSLSILLQGILGVVIGKISDRYGSKLVTLASGLFLGTAYLLMSQISKIWHLYLFFGVMTGIGMSAAWIPPVSTVAKWFIKYRGIMTGTIIAGIGAGISAGPLIANWLVSDNGWRNSYFILGISTLVLIFLLAPFLVGEPRKMGLLPFGDANESGFGTHGFSLGEALHTKRLWMLIFIYLAFGFCLESILVHIAPYAINLGILPDVAANIIAIIGAGSIAGRLIMGTVSDRATNRKVITFGYIMLVIALIILQVAKTMWPLYLFAAIFGFAYGNIYVILSPIVVELFGMTAHGAILGVIILGATIAGAIGPIAFGWIFDTTRSYQTAFLVSLIFGIMGLILVWFIRPIHKIVK